MADLSTFAGALKTKYPSSYLSAARRRMSGKDPATSGKRPTAPQDKPWMKGRSSLGGTPSGKEPSSTPKAPGVASRTKPGTVPPRKRGRRAEGK